MRAKETVPPYLHFLNIHVQLLLQINRPILKFHANFSLNCIVYPHLGNSGPL